MANPIIEAARLHFRPEEVRRFEVPEWGEPGKPLVLFAKPVTLADKLLFNNRYKTGGVQEMYVTVLIKKAKREDGSAAFTLDDKHALMNSVSPEVVERLAEAILLTVTVEEAAKN